MSDTCELYFNWGVLKRHHEKSKAKALHKFDEDTDGDELSEECRQELTEDILEIYHRLSTIGKKSSFPRNIGLGAAVFGAPAGIVGVYFGIGEATVAVGLLGGAAIAIGGIAVGAGIAVSVTLFRRYGQARKIKDILKH